MPDTKEFIYPNLLLVEGKNDQEFFFALRNVLNGEEHLLDIWSFNGISRLRSLLKTLPLLTGFGSVDAIGIVRDADDSFANAAHSVSDAFGKLWTTPPSIQAPIVETVMKSANSSGAFFDKTFKLGMFILPDMESTGELEDLICSSIEDENRMECVTEYLQCLEDKEIALRKRTKSQLYAYLASREKPGLRLATAAKENYIDLSSPAFDRVKTFLRNLIGHP